MSPPMGAARAGIAGARRTGDLPSTDMFQSPIYQWWAGEGIGVSDGQTASSWEDQLAQITASAVGGPIYRAAQGGKEAVEYDGGDDGHDWSPDAQLPSGTSSVSAVALVYFNATQSNYEAAAGHDIITVGHIDGQYGTIVTGQNNAIGGTVTSGVWDTVGFSYNGSEIVTYGGGSSVATSSQSTSFSASGGCIGYRRDQGSSYFNGYVSEVVYSATVESAQAFSDYHNDRTA